MLAALLAAGQQLRKSFCRTNVEWTRDGSFLSFFSDCVALPGVTRSSKREIKCRNKEVASVAGPLRFDWYLLKWAVVPLTRELNGKQRAKKKKVFYILREFFFFFWQDVSMNCVFFSSIWNGFDIVIPIHVCNYQKDRIAQLDYCMRAQNNIIIFCFFHLLAWCHTGCAIESYEF